MTGRAHAHTDYDTGSEPGHPAGGPLHLPVRSAAETVQGSGPLPAAAVDDFTIIQAAPGGDMATSAVLDTPDPRLL